LSGGIGGVWFRWEKARNRQSGSPRIAQMEEVLIGGVAMSLRDDVPQIVICKRLLLTELKGSEL
jgi:hypothetical protein